MKRLPLVLAVAGALALAAPASAQLGQLAGKAMKAKGLLDTANAFIFTDAEKRELGSQISAKLRERYGVVQSPSVHKYVSLVGSVVASAANKQGVTWTFVVLDTDGVNAFAAPGGFVHVTRGALALMQNEADLATVLGHEIGHVIADHTVSAIRNAKGVELAADATRNAILGKAAEVGYSVVIENAWNRGDEMEADRTGITLANTVGYAPGTLGTFLTRLSERNQGLKDRSGMFASHPDTKARTDGLAKLITSQKLMASATVEGRFRTNITYKPVAVTDVSAAVGGAAGLTGDAAGKAATSDGKGTAKPGEKPAETKAAAPKRGFGVGSLTSALGGEKKSTQTVASAGARGVNPDRDARGGANAAVVTVTVTPAELAEFRRGIAG